MKWIVGALVIAAVGYLIYRWTRPSPEQKACEKVVDLCGGGKDGIAECLDTARTLKKAVGEKAVRQFNECNAESRTCADAVGCATGSALKSGAGEFLRGLERSINH